MFNTATWIAILAIAVTVGLAIRYIYKEKKKGSHCVGCPYAGSCQKYAAGEPCEDKK